MTGANKMVWRAAALLSLLTLTTMPAKAQFAGFGGSGGDTMTQMAPMLEMMKAKMGKRRFGMMMQTMGPMMSRMMENGGVMGGGIPGGAIPGGFVGEGYMPDGSAMSPVGVGGFGGGDVTGMLGGAGGGELMGMIPQLIRIADTGGHGKRRHRRK